MRLSVVVVNWNSKDDLEACCASLEAQTHTDLEVIVVDNGSDDDSVAMMKARFPRFTLIEANANLGFAEGCNRGIDRASGEWISLLNNDAVADSRWAEALVIAAEKTGGEVGMLQSAMFFLDRPDTINSLGLLLTDNGGAVDRFEGEKQRAIAGGPIFCPTGGAAAYRRAMIDAVRLPTGVFDREFFMYSEDFDLGWRARLAGWSAELVPDSIVRHRFHGSTARRGRAWFVVITRTNRLRTLLKNASRRFLLTTAPQTAIELAELAWFGGPKAILALPLAIKQSLAQRKRVASIAVVDRREVERAWVGRR